MAVVGKDTVEFAAGEADVVCALAAGLITDEAKEAGRTCWSLAAPTVTACDRSRGVLNWLARKVLVIGWGLALPFDNVRDDPS